MATLKTLDELITALEIAGFETIDPQMIADAIQSVASVTGTIGIKAGTQSITIAGGWNRVDLVSEAISRDTQGMFDGLTDGTDPGWWYQLYAAAAGHFNFVATMTADVDTAGKYELSVAQVLGDGTVQSPTFINQANPTAAGEIQIVVAGIEKFMEGTERLQLQIRGPSGSIVTPLSMQMQVSSR